MNTVNYIWFIVPFFPLLSALLLTSDAVPLSPHPSPCLSPCCLSMAALLKLKWCWNSNNMGHKVGHCPIAFPPSEKKRWCSLKKQWTVWRCPTYSVADSVFFPASLSLSWFCSLSSVSQLDSDWLLTYSASLSVCVFFNSTSALTRSYFLNGHVELAHTSSSYKQRFRFKSYRHLWKLHSSDSERDLW